MNPHLREEVVDALGQELDSEGGVRVPGELLSQLSEATDVSHQYSALEGVHAWYQSLESRER